jgi:hypothetical protein
VEIHVWTSEPPEGADAKAAGPPLSVTVEGDPATPGRPVTADEIAALPGVAAGDRPGRRAAFLLDVAALVLPRTRIAGLRAEGREGEPIRIERDALADPDLQATLRLNNRGQWVAEVLGATGPSVSGPTQIRGVVRLVLIAGDEGPALEPARPDTGEEASAEPTPGRLFRVALPTEEERARIHELVELTRGSRDPAARARIVEALSDPSEAVRLRAVRSLSLWKDAVPDLLAHMDREPSADIQETCVDFIGHLGDADVIPRLQAWGQGRSRRLLKAVDKAVRRIARDRDLAGPGRLLPR